MKDDKKIKGKYRIIKKYTAASVFSGIFSILGAGIPVLMLFFPLINFIYYPSGTETTLSINAISLIKNVFFVTDTSFLEYLAKLEGGMWAGNILCMVFSLIFVLLFILYAVVAIFAVFAVISGIEYIIRGRNSSAKNAVSFARVNFIVTTVMVAIILFLGIGYPMIAPANTLNAQIGIVTYVSAGATLVVLIVIGSIYNAHFRNSYYANEVIVKNKIKDKPVEISEPVAPAPVVVPVVKNRVIEITSNELPENLTNIGGHAFAQNLYLEKAIIPPGITRIGDAAFANCGNLKILFIPRSCKEICKNAFFNCRKLKLIKYGGTKAEWSKIVRGSNWLLNAGTNKVVTLDGGLIVNKVK